MTPPPPPTDGSAPPVFTRYGFTRTPDPAAPLRIAPYAEICADGALCATVVASAIDVVGGFAARAAAGSDATFTVDLSLRIPRPRVPGSLLARAEPLRVGRRLVTTGVRLEAERGLYAYGETSFLRSPREGPGPDVAALATPETIPFHPLDRPLAEAIGIETLAGADGRVRLALRPELRNPEGALQGALVALVVECSARALAGGRRDGPTVVTGLDLRYLAAARVGPVEAQAEWIGPPEDGALRVVLCDRGREGRRTASALVRVADAAPRSGAVS